MALLIKPFPTIGFFTGLRFAGASFVVLPIRGGTESAVKVVTVPASPPPHQEAHQPALR